MGGGGRLNSDGGLFNLETTMVSVLHKKMQSWTKVLGHFSVSGAFSNSHRSNTSPHPTNNVGGVYPEFFRVYHLPGALNGLEKDLKTF